MKKRGAGNIEFILSFVMFAGFVVAALYLFNPVKDIGSMDSARAYVFDTISKNASIKLDSHSIKVISMTARQGVVGIELAGFPERKVRAEDYYGKKLDAYKSGTSVYVRSGGKDFMVLKFAEDFEESAPFTRRAIDPSEYQIASSISGEVLSEKRIIQLNESYWKDYAFLKKALGIPSNVDFSFSLEFSNGNAIKAERAAAVRREVFSETRMLEVLKKDGTSEFAYLMVKIW
jgi:hypothetical protein